MFPANHTNPLRLSTTAGRIDWRNSTSQQDQFIDLASVQLNRGKFHKDITRMFVIAEEFDMRVAIHKMDTAWMMTGKCLVGRIIDRERRTPQNEGIWIISSQSDPRPSCSRMFRHSI